MSVLLFTEKTKNFGCTFCTYNYQCKTPANINCLTVKKSAYTSGFLATAVPRNIGWPHMLHHRKHRFSALLFFLFIQQFSFNTFAFYGACIEQSYRVLDRFVTLLLSVLKSDDGKLSPESVLLISSIKSCIESSKSRKVRRFSRAVALDVDTISISLERLSHDTGGALLLSRWRQLIERTRKAPNSNGTKVKIYA